MTLSTNQVFLITDAMKAYGDYRDYRAQVQMHFGNAAGFLTEAGRESFALTLFEKARQADLMIKKAGLHGISADSWLWAQTIKGHLEGGRLGHCNKDLLLQLIAEVA